MLLWLLTSHYLIRRSPLRLSRCSRKTTRIVAHLKEVLVSRPNLDRGNTVRGAQCSRDQWTCQIVWVISWKSLIIKNNPMHCSRYSRLGQRSHHKKETKRKSLLRKEQNKIKKNKKMEANWLKYYSPWKKRRSNQQLPVKDIKREK